MLPYLVPINSMPGLALIGKVIGADISTSAADITIPMVIPTGFSRYRINNINVVANGGSSWNGATIQLYTAASSGGTALTASTALSSLTSNAADTAGNLQALSSSASTVALDRTSVFAHVNTGAGVASTVDIYLYGLVIV